MTTNYTDIHRPGIESGTLKELCEECECDPCECDRKEADNETND